MNKDICTLFPVYSQIWLNLPRDDRHFFNIVPKDDPSIATLATNRNSFEKQGVELWLADSLCQWWPPKLPRFDTNGKSLDPLL
jgi:hypothetical protein